MFLRVSSLRCASFVESKICFCNLFRVSSTSCEVVNPQRARSHIAVLALDGDLAVGKWLLGVSRNEQKSGATRRIPASEQVRRAADRGFGKQRLRPAPNVTQLGRAPRQQTQCGAESVRGAEKMRHGVPALRKNVRTDSRLIIEQSTFVWVGGRRIHARAEVDEHAVVAVAALDDDRSRIETEARRVHEIFGGENADLCGPLERGEGLV